MGIYIILLLFSFFAAKTSRNSNKIGLFIVFVLFLLSAGRAESVGNDTPGYYNNVFSSSFEGVTHKFEFVFITLCDLIRDYGLNSRCCIYILSFVTFLFLYLASKRYRVNLAVVSFFYLLFLFYTQSIHIARQMAACSILLYAYSFLFIDVKLGPKGNIKKILCFIVFTLLAMSFHSGAIIGIIALLFYLATPVVSKAITNIKITYLNLFIFLFLLFAITQLLRSVLLPRFQEILSIADIYEGYETREREMSLFGTFYNGIVFFFHSYIVLYLFKTQNNKLGSFFLCTIFMRILLAAFNGVIYRLIFYFSIIDVVVYAICFSHLINKKKLFFLLMLLYFGVDYILVHVNNTYETVPYAFKFFEI